MADTPQSLADRLRVEGGRVTSFFSELKSDQWDLIVYKHDDTWDLHKLLAHFVSAEIGRGELITSIIHGGEGVPRDFIIDQYNHSEVERLSGDLMIIC
jgi:hypothetical protein